MAKNELINGCIKVEKSAASIYKKLMKKFPDRKDFWKELFDDEISHLSFLNDVKSLGLTDEIQKMEASPSISLVNEAVKMAENIIAKIIADSISFKKALSMALKLEESAVETYTNKIIADLISCEDELAYKKMVADTKKHINKIKKMMKK
jgi:rubrerythrin